MAASPNNEVAWGDWLLAAAQSRGRLAARAGARDGSARRLQSSLGWSLSEHDPPGDWPKWFRNGEINLIFDDVCARGHGPARALL